MGAVNEALKHIKNEISRLKKSSAIQTEYAKTLKDRWTARAIMRDVREKDKIIEALREVRDILMSEDGREADLK